MKHQVYYITDTYCCWCFGFSNTINAIEKDYADKIRVNVLNGVMISNNVSLENFFNRFPDPVRLHNHISEKSGRNFGSNYLNMIHDLSSSNRILNSNIPAKAMIAFKLLGINELSAATKIQEAHYSDGIDIQKIESYEDISNKLAISYEEFKKVYLGSACTTELNRELSLIRKLGVSGFPAVVIMTKNNDFKVISNGFVSYDNIKKLLDREIEIDNVAELEKQ